MSRSSPASKRSILVPLGGGLVAFAAIGLGQLANHPEDFSRSVTAAAQTVSDPDPRFDFDFTLRSQGLIHEAARVDTRAVRSQSRLEQVENALERHQEMDHEPRPQGPAESRPDSTERPVLPLEP